MVARKFGVGIDLGGKQAKGMVLENLASDNVAIAKEGSVYFNTTDKKLKIYQDGSWEEYATNEELSDASGDLQDAIDEINGKIGSGFDSTNTVAKAISDEKTRATTAEKALDDKINAETTRASGVEDDIISELENLGAAIWEGYRSHKLNGGKFMNTINDDDIEAVIFNEKDGGGLKITNNDSAAKIVSSVCVNNGGDNVNDITAQIYSKYTDDDVALGHDKNYGSRLNVNPHGIYYTKGTLTNATANNLRNEVAVLKDIDTLEASVDDKLALKANAVDVYTKNEVDTKLSTVYNYKGSIILMEQLVKRPASSNKVGDVWNVEYKLAPGGDPDDPDESDLIPWGMNVAWVGEEVQQQKTIPAHWDELGQIIDLSAYAKLSDIDTVYSTIAATYETIANCNTIRGRLDSLESQVSSLESDVDDLKALTAKQPKIYRYDQDTTLTPNSNHVAVWEIDYKNELGLTVNDVQVTIKEIATGEEVVADVKQSTGQGSSKGKVTISFETDSAIPADTYRAIIIG